MRSRRATGSPADVTQDRATRDPGRARAAETAVAKRRHASGSGTYGLVELLGGFFGFAGCPLSLALLWTCWDGVKRSCCHRARRDRVPGDGN
jgi:hypothetical protein